MSTKPTHHWVAWTFRGGQTNRVSGLWPFLYEPGGANRHHAHPIGALPGPPWHHQHSLEAGQVGVSFASNRRIFVKLRRASNSRNPWPAALHEHLHVRREPLVGVYPARLDEDDARRHLHLGRQRRTTTRAKASVDREAACSDVREYGRLACQVKVPPWDIDHRRECCPGLRAASIAMTKTGTDGCRVDRIPNRAAHAPAGHGRRPDRCFSRYISHRRPPISRAGSCLPYAHHDVAPPKLLGGYPRFWSRLSHSRSAAQNAAIALHLKSLPHLGIPLRPTANSPRRKALLYIK